jgi:NAD(P)-dependent dehydrogenase (short-subunit alcohol dehydrogenase family)
MPMLGLYNAAKWGLEGWAEAMAAEVAAFGIRTTIVEPGAAKAWPARTGALAICEGGVAVTATSDCEDVPPPMPPGRNDQTSPIRRSRFAIRLALSARRVLLSMRAE